MRVTSLLLGVFTLLLSCGDTQQRLDEFNSLDPELRKAKKLTDERARVEELNPFETAVSAYRDSIAAQEDLSPVKMDSTMRMRLDAMGTLSRKLDATDTMSPDMLQEALQLLGTERLEDLVYEDLSSSMLQVELERTRWELMHEVRVRGKR